MASLAFRCAASALSFDSCLIEVVNRGGDADTTGAIAGMIAGAFYEFDSIPEVWLRALDGAVLQECLQQAESLVELSPMYRDQNQRQHR